MVNHVHLINRDVHPYFFHFGTNVDLDRLASPPQGLPWDYSCSIANHPSTTFRKRASATEMWLDIHGHRLSAAASVTWASRCLSVSSFTFCFCKAMEATLRAWRIACTTGHCSQPTSGRFSHESSSPWKSGTWGVVQNSSRPSWSG